MARFSSAKPRFATASRRFAVAKTDHDTMRRTLVEWRAWYNTKAWRRLRWSILVRDNFTCRRCGVVEADSSKLVADHITPHRGDETLFWEDGNLQCMCARCHNSAKQREETAARRGGGSHL